MSNRITSRPDIPIPNQANLVEAVAALREAMNVALTRAGDPLDGFVSFRDLKTSGIADVVITGSGGGSAGRPNRPGGDRPGIRPRPPGTRRPPTPLNITTRGLFTGITVYWSIDTTINAEWRRAEIWAAAPSRGSSTSDDPRDWAVPGFDQAILVGTASNTNFFHSGLGHRQVRYYWVRYIGFDANGNDLADPFYPSTAGPGVFGQTATDPADMLSMLTSSLGLAQLNAELFNVVNAGPQAITRVQVVENAASNLAARLTSSYSVTIDLGGYVSGFGFLATESADPNNPAGPPVRTSAFIVRTSTFALVSPDAAPGTPESYPFTAGQIRNPAWFPGAPPNIPRTIFAVGIKGDLIVDGTIWGDSIVAGSIGADRIDVTELYAGFLDAERVIGGSFSTSNSTNWRVELNGPNAPDNKSQFPLWIGQGPTGFPTIDPNGPNPLFYVYADQSGPTAYLGGPLMLLDNAVIGSSADSLSTRVEIGTGWDGFLFWAGTGVKNEENANFLVRGLPLTVPVATTNSNQLVINVTPRAGANTAPVFVMATVTLQEGGGPDDKKFKLGIIADGNLIGEYQYDDVNQEITTFAISALATLLAGPRAITITVTNENGTMNIVGTNFIAFQIEPGGI